jgi:hypothetical protein
VLVVVIIIDLLQKRLRVGFDGRFKQFRRNGDIFHLETTLTQYLPLSKQTLIGVGANAFLLQQVTGDSGSDALLGDLKGLTSESVPPSL